MKLFSLIFVFFLFLEQTHAAWQSQYYRDHPLVGKIFSSKHQQWITEQDLVENLQSKQFILLGETHTNLDHHIGQARLIQKWLTNDNPTALVFEMLTNESWQDHKLPKLGLKALNHKLQEVASGWDWDLYQPILKLQIKYQLPMFGGNLTREQLGEYSSQGQCQVTRHRLSLNICELLNSEQQLDIKQLIFDAHCGYLSMEQTQPMMQVQLAKDASFALTMANLKDQYQIALIAGAVHVRKDIGVPVHLQKLGFPLHETVASVAFLNVDPNKLQISDYFSDANITHQYDYVIFTPSERNQDPCEEFADQLKKMKHSKPSKSTN